MFEKKILGAISKHRLIPKKSKLLVGISGGPDSLVLLHFLKSVRELLEIELTAAHIDHMIRGEESYQDFLFVKKICQAWNIPFEGKRINVPVRMQKTGESTELAARTVRYAFFDEVIRRKELDLLVLGHHADDQIETMLMRMARGATGKARGGIPVIRAFGKAKLVRPFLAVSKDEIMQYARSHGLEPRVDPSNEQDIYTRNRFRHSMLPFLKRENPKVHEHFQRLSEEIYDDEQFLLDMARDKLGTIMLEQNQDFSSVDIRQFSTVPKPLQRRMIQLILNYLYIERPSSLSALHIDQLFALFSNPHPSAELHLPEGLIAEKSYGTCFFRFFSNQAPEYSVVLEIPGDTFLPNGYKIKAQYIEEEIPKTIGNHSFIFESDKLRLPLIARTRSNGDRMAVKGSGGTKKLKDIFINEKIPMSQRNAWPVVTDQAGEIIWLPGLKKSNREFDGATDEMSLIYLEYTKHRSSGGQTITMTMQNDIEKVLITEEEIQGKIRELAAQLEKEYSESFPLAIGVLKGAMPFMADLLKRIDAHLEMDFMDVSSYGNSTVSSGEVKIIKDLDTSVEGRDILIIEDIIDSGLTLSYLVELFRYRKAKTIKIVTLLDKPTGRKADLKPDYTGFIVPDEFVVGYGLDYAERYRNLPYIGVLKPEIYENK
ncbi:hypoxanthine phosphoribosyltransferase [Bacillus sp. OV322]|nr:hypoxanthine phosphoribosyltransferase [Bacillus sp. OV322]